MLVPLAADAVRGLDLVAELESSLSGDDGTNDGFVKILGLEIAAAGHELVRLRRAVGVRTVVDFVEQLRRRADDAKQRAARRFVAVAQAHRDRQLGNVGELATRKKLLVVGVRYRVERLADVV